MPTFKNRFALCSAMIELISIDLAGTIVPCDKGPIVVRPGFKEFMEAYRPHTILVMFTDGYPETVQEYMDRVPELRLFEAIYDSRHCMYIPGDGPVKNLKKLLHDAGIAPELAVHIGDNWMNRDRMSAEQAGVRFIRIPQFRHNAADYHERDRNDGFVIYEDPKQPWSFLELVGKID